MRGNWKFVDGVQTTKHPLWARWQAMISRCRYPSAISYPRYGGRGISVCEQWTGKHGFRRFVRDVGPPPSPDHQLDRINNDGNYDPGNVRWATAKEQASNRHGICGERHHQAKFSAAQIAEIRRAYAAGEGTQKQLGARFGTSQSNIQRIVTHETWK